jgi:hypothetical protein
MTEEESVRQYLLYLEDPTKLVDHDEVERLRAQVDDAGDPVARLLAITALEKAQQVDGGRFRADFVRHARAWAEEAGVSASAFQKLDPPVPDDVLEDAGFDVGPRRATLRALRAPRPAPKAARSARVDADELRAWMLGRSEPFTVSQAQQAVGGSQLTVRKVIDGLVASGQLIALGPLAGHGGRGKAPNSYQPA